MRFHSRFLFWFAGHWMGGCYKVAFQEPLQRELEWEQETERHRRRETFWYFVRNWAIKPYWNCYKPFPEFTVSTGHKLLFQLQNRQESEWRQAAQDTHIRATQDMWKTKETATAVKLDLEGLPKAKASIRKRLTWGARSRGYLHCEFEGEFGTAFIHYSSIYSRNPILSMRWPGPALTCWLMERGWRHGPGHGRINPRESVACFVF